MRAGRCGPDRRPFVDRFVESAYRSYHRTLQRFLIRRLRSTERAEDVAQEVYIRLLRVEDTELIRKPQAYIYRIATNVVYEMMLRERNDPVAFDSSIVDSLAELPYENSDDVSARLSTSAQLDAVLNQLPPIYRIILVLRKRDGKSNSEIAKEMGISPHTVKKYLVRAVAQCRAARWDR